MTVDGGEDNGTSTWHDIHLTNEVRIGGLSSSSSFSFFFFCLFIRFFFDVSFLGSPPTHPPTYTPPRERVGGGPSYVLDICNPLPPDHPIRGDQWGGPVWRHWSRDVAAPGTNETVTSPPLLPNRFINSTFSIDWFGLDWIGLDWIETWNEEE